MQDMSLIGFDFFGSDWIGAKEVLAKYLVSVMSGCACVCVCVSVVFLVERRRQNAFLHLCFVFIAFQICSIVFYCVLL